MRLAYATTYDPASVLSWSGTIYFLARALEDAGIQVLHPPRPASIYRLFARACARARWRLLGHQYLVDKDPVLLTAYGKQTSRWLRHSDAEIILSPGISPLGYIDTDRPTAYWADATLAGLVGFYPEYSTIPRRVLDRWYAVEHAVVTRARVGIYSSAWAADTASVVYGLDRSKLHVVAFGANLDSPPSDAQADQFIHERDFRTCRLLFLGTDWLRKGGDAAISVAAELDRMGIPAQLTIVGSDVPGAARRLRYVRAYPFLNKWTTAGAALLRDLLSSAHFLLLPTLADCTPMVFAEANAFGVPCITRRVGGIPTVIRDDLNGRAFDPDVPPHDYARYIARIFSDRAQYRELACSSRSEYAQRLNWRVAAAEVHDLLASALGSPGRLAI